MEQWNGIVERKEPSITNLQQLQATVSNNYSEAGPEKGAHSGL